jgi:hypothetical protein
MLTRLSSVVVVVATTTLCLAVDAGVTALAAVTPTVEPTQNSVRLGQVVVVSGHGWQPREEVAVELCGGGGEDQATQCAQASSVVTSIWPDGTLYTQLRVVKPAVPCPCVVLATAVQSRKTARGALAIAGVPSAPLTSHPQDQAQLPVQVSSARLTGGSNWKEWFGASPKRVLVVTMRNPSIVDRHVTVTAYTARGAHGGDFAGGTDVQTLVAAQSATVRIPVSLPMAAIGKYHVHGSASSTIGSANFDATTRVVPWGLFGIVLLIVAAVLLAVRKLWLPLARRIAAAHSMRPRQVAEVTTAPTRPDSFPYSSQPEIPTQESPSQTGGTPQ